MNTANNGDDESDYDNGRKGFKKEGGERGENERKKSRLHQQKKKWVKKKKSNIK